MWRLLLSALLINLDSSAAEDNLLVETNKGKVKGLTLKAATGKEVDAWLGIPFAEPPTGDKRFKKPTEKSSWSDTLDATEQPNSCVQTMDYTFGDFPGSTMWNANTERSEDCLYLNVVVPKPRPTKAAVMVWIFGGGFYCGSATLDVYDPKTLASEENVIVVSVQHRLASLGFLYLGTSDVNGNMGLYDQRMAFQWVQDNIEKFGGDKSKVTVFGMSSGSTSAALHLVAPDSYNLFNNAILESGTALSPWTLMPKEENKNRGLALAAHMGCDNSNDPTAAAECLRKAANTTEMVYREWDDEVTPSLSVYDFPFVPVVDTEFFAKPPNQILSGKEFKKTNLLLGSNKEEGYFFLFYFLRDILKKEEGTTVTEEQYKNAVERILSNMKPETRQEVLEKYKNWMDNSDPHKYRDALDKMVGDSKMTCSINEFADAYAQGTDDVYVYVFDRISNVSPWPKWTKAMHGEEVYYVFGEPLNTTKGYSEEDKTLARNMMKYWANFAKTGNPNKDESGTKTDVEWPKYTTSDKKHLVLAPKLEVGAKHREEQCNFWKSVEAQSK